MCLVNDWCCWIYYKMFLPVFFIQCIKTKPFCFRLTFIYWLIFLYSEGNNTYCNLPGRGPTPPPPFAWALVFCVVWYCTYSYTPWINKYVTQCIYATSQQQQQTTIPYETTPTTTTTTTTMKPSSTTTPTITIERKSIQKSHQQR